MKISEKVAFDIASKASNVYILMGKKFIKMPKMVNFGEFLKTEACGQTELPDGLLLIIKFLLIILVITMKTKEL